MSMNIKPQSPPIVSGPLVSREAPASHKAMEEPDGDTPHMAVGPPTRNPQADLLQGYHTELQDINRALSGDLSNFSRLEVEEMMNRALAIEAHLEALRHPHGVLANGPNR